jgi:glycerophosphoryl diester phosphodiesterase
MLDTWYTGQPLIFGHRGASAYAPMNTLPAFELAVEQGADGIELDVHRSLDGHAVIVHDFTVDATTDGSGKVAEMTLAQLKEFDAGSWFSTDFRGVRLPTLDEVFEAVGQKVYINVEIKSNTPETDGVEQVVADVIARHNLQQRVIISSFNPLALKRFRDILPVVPIGFLYSVNMPVDTHHMMRELNLPHEARHPHHDLVDEAYMKWAREHGYRVNAWTVNDLERAIALRDLGVDAIITDKPIDLLRALRGE